MGITVNTNTTSINALNNLNRTRRSLQSTFKKISSGLRINSASDDAAGLAVSEKLNAANRSLKVAQRNTQDGISTIQVAEGSTNEVANIVKRMRELAVQSSSETLASPERAFIQDEFSQASAEIERIAQTTEFNGVKLADGATTTVAVQVGKDNTANDRITISLADLRATVLGVSTGNIDLSTSTGAQAALTALDAALLKVNSYRSKFGATQNRLESASRNLETVTENMSASESRIRDADFAQETAQMSKYNIMQQAGVAILSQANGLNQSALRLVG